MNSKNVFWNVLLKCHLIYLKLHEFILKKVVCIYIFFYYFNLIFLIILNLIQKKKKNEIPFY